MGWIMAEDQARFPAHSAPPVGRVPRPGEFLTDREVADALQVHLPALNQIRQWCGNFRAEPRVVNAIAELRTAIDILRTERHR